MYTESLSTSYEIVWKRSKWSILWQTDQSYAKLEKLIINFYNLIKSKKIFPGKNCTNNQWKPQQQFVQKSFSIWWVHVLAMRCGEYWRCDSSVTNTNTPSIAVKSHFFFQCLWMTQCCHNGRDTMSWALCRFMYLNLCAQSTQYAWLCVRAYVHIVNTRIEIDDFKNKTYYSLSNFFLIQFRTSFTCNLIKFFRNLLQTLHFHSNWMWKV